MSSELCLFHCSFWWFIPRYLNNTAVTVLNNTAVTVPNNTTATANNTTVTVNNTTVTVNNTTVTAPISFLEDDSITEACTPNTWLWVVETSEEGEAHFIVGNNIINNVSGAHFYSYMTATQLGY